MRRFDCLEVLVEQIGDDLAVVNLANTSTEWHSLRPTDANLYFTGMGMVTPYATGLALALPHRRVVALDGDGGALFDLSAFATLAKLGLNNLTVIVFDNASYASTGNYSSTQSLSHDTVNLESVLRGCGITQVSTVATQEAFREKYLAAREGSSGPHVIVARVDRGQAHAGTLLIDGRENKYRFVRHIEKLEGRQILKPSDREHGVPPKPDPEFSPVEASDRFAKTLHAGLRENGVDFVAGLPCSGMSAVQQLCIEDDSMRYIGVAHEGTGFGLCAGAWLGGKRPAVLVENLGVFASAYHLLRGHYSLGIPTLILAEYRGDAGDTEFFADCGDMTEGMLSAMRINYRLVESLVDLKPAIRDALRWMNFGLRPYALLPRFELTRHRLQPRPLP